MGEAQDRFRFHGRYPWKWGGVVHGVPCQRHGLSHEVVSKNKNRTEQIHSYTHGGGGRERGRGYIYIYTHTYIYMPAPPPTELYRIV